jgi:DNA-binding NarL/FixJ family response regulator
MLAEKTSGEIAEQLNISEKTVHGHRQKLLEKTGAKGNIGLVFFAIDRGIIKLKN